MREASHGRRCGGGAGARAAPRCDAPAAPAARQRPHTIDGGSDFGWAGIRWSSWGGRVAIGRGHYWYDDKSVVPYRRLRFPMRFRMSAPDVCYGQLRCLRPEQVRTTRSPKLRGLPHRSARNLSCEHGQWG